ncbi:hypothetical protein [Pseudomonas koreensis]|uniref:hypothetical protein n=1 Tax=Pseudomonas koreensis TaxID=198620 RepID=UPI00320B8492
MLLPISYSNLSFSNSAKSSGTTLQGASNHGEISVSSQVLDDLELFCDELLSNNFFGAGKDLNSKYSRMVTIPKAECWAYNQYREGIDDVVCLPLDTQVSILKSVISTKPDNIKILIQDMNTQLDENTAKSLGANAINALVIIGNDGGFSQEQEGRISIKINPECYNEAFTCLCSLKDKFPNEISHSKLMLPSVVGGGPEDAVIYLSDSSRIGDIVTELKKEKGMMRPSENGIFFMDELAPGIYNGVLPQEAYLTDETGAAGSLGMYYSKLAVRAIVYSLTQAVSPREAAEFVLNQAGLRVKI